MADSRQVQIENAVVATIRGIGLTGMATANIRRMVDLNDREATEFISNDLPCVLVSSGGAELMDPTKGTNASDDLTYPVDVIILDRANQDQTAGSAGDVWMLWRELIAKAFHNKGLSGVAAVYQCVVMPNAIKDKSSWNGMNLLFSALQLKATARVARGA